MVPQEAHPGGNRLIDYCLVASSIQHMVKLVWNLQGPWASPHMGIKGAVKHAGQKLMKRIMEQPMECQLAAGPDRSRQHRIEAGGPAQNREGHAAGHAAAAQGRGCGSRLYGVRDGGRQLAPW
eukprot:7381107-Pyramimonas_sp.AAC.1